MPITENQANHVLTCGAPPVARPQIRNFRSFIKPPCAAQQFRIRLGECSEFVDPRSNIAQLRQMMRRLSKLMQASADRDNKYIPAGYTYLTQFVAHDMVDSSAHFWEGGNAALVNNRRERLRLEVLYGGGPVQDPLLYAADPTVPAVLTRLRLGRSANSPAGACPFRDLARPGYSNWTGAGLPPREREQADRYAGWRVPIAADARSDYHALMAQLVVVFCLLHNAIVDRLAKHSEPTEAQAQSRFKAARQATTLIFRNIVRQDLLPRLLHAGIRNCYDACPRLYDAPPRTFLDSGMAASARSPLPLEFAYGAFRFGHSMVRRTYALNDTTTADPIQLIQHTSKYQGNVPLTQDWLVSWRRFFGPAAQQSQLIGPAYSPLLGDSAVSPVDSGACLAGAAGWHGLAYGDLMNAALAGLWSVRALLAERRIAALIPPTSFLRDGSWQHQLEAWLQAGNPQLAVGMDDRLTAAEIKSIAQDPPLPFFVLFEAAYDPAAKGGNGLGVLGSIIVADVIYAGLLKHRLAYEERPTLQVALSDIAKTAVDPVNAEILDEFAAAANQMDALIEHLSTAGYAVPFRPSLF